MYVACGFDGIANGPGAFAPVDDAGDERPTISMGDGSSADGPLACSLEQTMCGADCTDLKADPKNCGACGMACSELQTCDQGKCTVLCVNESLRCNDSCIDPQTDPLHCGSCTNACAPGLLCSAGACTTDCGALSTCPLPATADAGTATAYCTDEQTDNKNCGACGKACKANQLCKAGVCKDVCTDVSRVGDVFAPNMVGCVQTASWFQRIYICPPGSKVCSAQEWTQRHGTKTPTYDYWTDDDLRWSGADQKCSVSATSGNYCDYGTPMRVCAGKTDPLGNQCRWTNCGFNGTTPNQYLGGCIGNKTAGAVCCTP
ncbi:MAG: Tryptophan synthase alpha chain [Labilithrix sp.]|nr:Tryptophan synthase alpha chain [Labilithrix sp.]